MLDRLRQALFGRFGCPPEVTLPPRHPVPGPVWSSGGLRGQGDRAGWQIGTSVLALLPRWLRWLP